ncbi:MAG: hypothetical protein AAGA72_09605 [Pseudomonadota bacterium]
MSGRDAYLEMGFSDPSRSESEQVNVEADPRAKRAAEADRYALAVNKAAPEPSSSAGFRDYFVGLLILAAALAVGLAWGYYARGMGLNVNPIDTSVKILGTQPVPAIEALGTGNNTDVVFIGSPASDQILGIEALPSGDALLMIKSHLGPSEDGTRSHLVSYSAPLEVGEGHALTSTNLFDGQGLHLVRLGDDSVIVMSVLEEQLTVSRVNESGGFAWSKSFATGAIDRNEVALAPYEDGFVFVAPNESRELSRVVSIKADGAVSWEKLFDRPRSWQRSHVSVDAAGNTFAILGGQERSLGVGDLNIVIMDDNGRVMRQRILSLSGEDVVSGIAPRSDGGVVFLISGGTPRLVQLGASGQRVATTELPYMNFLNDAHLLVSSGGDIVVASTYSLIGNRVDMVIEQRSQDGLLQDQRTISLPEGATLDELVEIDQGEYLTSGSLRRDRYMPTDLFVQRIAFAPNSIAVATADLDASFVESEALLTGSEAELDPISAAAAIAPETPSGETDAALATDAPVVPAEPDATPVLATITLAADAANEEGEDTIDGALDAEPSAETEPDPISVTAQPDAVDTEIDATEAPEAEPVTSLAATTGDQGDADGTAFVDTTDLNAAATSRMADAPIATTCRFECLDPVSGSSFPMSGTLATSLLNSVEDIRGAHARVCQAATLMPVFDTGPECSTL